MSLKVETARQYREKHGPNVPTLQLARIMYKENKLLFKDVEDARARLRYIEGKYGKVNKKSVVNTAFVKEGERPHV